MDTMPGLTTNHSGGPPPNIQAWLEEIRDDAYNELGYPRATDLPYPELGARLSQVRLINVGDPWDDGNGNISQHSNIFERAAVNAIADLLAAPATRWGFVTTGSAAAIEHAITSAAYTFGDNLTCYASTSAHGCVTEICARYRIPLVTVRAQPRGAIDILDLRHQLDIRRHRPAIIIATLGTRWGDAIDDLTAINHITDELALGRVHLHADAAHCGIPLALLPEGQRPPCTFADAPALTSWSTSGHTFLGVTRACAAIVYPHRPNRPANTLHDIGAADPTSTGSRSGALPIELWHQLTRIPLHAHHQRAETSRQLATHLHQELTEAGWPCWMNPHGFSVVLQRPPEPVLDRWNLSHQQQWSQIKVMPGMTKDQLEHVVDDMTIARDLRDAGNDDDTIRSELGIDPRPHPTRAAHLASI